MDRKEMRVFFCLFLLLVALSALGQQVATNNAAVVPPLVNFSGTLTDINGKPLTTIVGVTFFLYNDQQALSPLWMETQNVAPDRNGRYSVQLGSTSSTGLPADIFVAGEARWLGVQPEGQAEYPRVMLLSVPYALKAGDAQTIGGLPPSAFLLAPSATGAPSSTRTSGSAPPTSSPVTGSGTVNFLPLWDGTSDIISSALFQSGSTPTAMIGINTATPSATLDVATGDVLLEAGNLDLPQTSSATNGVITMGGAPFISACCAANTFNTFVGNGAGNLTTPGTLNTAFGYQALNSINSIGTTSNTAVGTDALKADTGGSDNTAIGTGALQVNTFGTSNTAVGAGALESTGGGPSGNGGLWNTAVGSGAGVSNTRGNNNTFIGQGADAATQTLNYATAIGSGAVVGESNAMVLGGTIANGNAVKVGIGTPTPGYTLDVQGNANFTGPVNFAAGQPFPNTISAVTPTAGGGLVSSTTSGNVMIGMTTACASGQVLQWNGGAWACSTAGLGTITGVTNGTGLTGGGTTGNVTLNVDPTQVPFLNAANVFTGNQTVNGNLSATGLVTGSGFQIGSNLFAFGSFANQNALLGFAGNATMTGNYNTASGYGALGANTSGGGNTASGIGALGVNTTGANNTAVGNGALLNNTSGGLNIAIGAAALSNNSTATRNVAIGANALDHATTGGWNTAVGNYAGSTRDSSFISNYGLTFLGADSAISTGSLTNATAVGYAAEVDSSNALVLGAINGVNGATASTNVGIGTTTPQYSLDVNGTANFTGLVKFASNQTFPGNGTVSSVGSGAGLIGGPITSSGTLSIATAGVTNAMLANPSVAVSPGPGLTGGGSVPLGGAITLSLDTTQVPLLNNANTFTGSQTVSGNLSATGLVTGSGFQIGSNLFAFGSYANQNALLGFAGNATMTGNFNTASGYGALGANTSGVGNTASGNQALGVNTTGANNTAVGNGALLNNTSGGLNIAIGAAALSSNSSASRNVAIGANALDHATTGGWNTAVGNFAGSTRDSSFISNVGVTFLGADSAMSTGSLTNATAVGYAAEVDSSNALVLGSINGVNGATANTNVGIGTTTPAYTLDVHGTANFTGLVNFSPNQTFPGNGTVTSVSSGAGLTGGPITSTGTLSIAPAGVTNAMLANPSLTVSPGTGLTGGGSVPLGSTTTLSLDTTQVPLLNNTNTFTGSQTVNGNLSATGAVTGSAFNIGSNLFAFGSYANSNVFLGFSGNSTTTGNGNTATGFQALNSNAGGLVNTATGYLALYSNQTGNNDAATGSRALYSNTTGIDNTAMGTNALISNTKGGDNTATGSGALYYNTTGNYNTASGYLASSANITGSNNAAFGFKALLSNTLGNDNSASGYEALYSNTGSENTANGSQALYFNTTGYGNTASGYLSLQLNSTGYANTSLGGETLLDNTTGNGNTGTGAGALLYNTTGNYNTGVGYDSGLVLDESFMSGQWNTFLGVYTAAGTGTFNNATAVGAYAEAGASNSLVLGSIAGVNNCTGANSCASTNVGIGTITPAYTLDVEAPSGSAPTVNFGSASNPAALTVHGTGNFTGLVTFAPNQTFPGTGNGTITGVTPTAGGGLLGGGTTGNVSLGLTNSCASGQVLQWSGAAWTCSTISGGGTITGVTPGTDLVGGGSSGVVSLSLDTTKVPQLATPNSFAGTQTIAGNLALTGPGNGVQFPDGTLQTTAATGGGGSIPSGYMILGSTSTAPPGYTLTGILGGTGQWSAGPGIPIAKAPFSSGAALVNAAIDFVAPETNISGQTVLGNLWSWDTFGGWNQLPITGSIPLVRTVTAVEANGLLWAIMGANNATPGQVCSYASSVWTCNPVPRAEADFAVASTNVSTDPVIEVIGGETRGSSGSIASSLVQIFDTVTGQWTYSSLPNPLAQSAAATLNGSVYVFGGHGSVPTGSSACASSTNAGFVLGGAAIANIPVYLYGATATVFNGKVYLIGGVTCISSGGGLKSLGPGNSVFIYDPGTNTWSSGLSMPANLTPGFSAVSLNGKIFVVDGSSLSVWEYAPPVYMFTKN